MIRNAFAIRSTGETNHFEPTFRKGCEESAMVRLALLRVTEDSGLVLVTGQTVTTDALMSLRAIISDQLADMARNELEEMA